MKDKHILILYHGHFEEGLLSSLKQEIHQKFNYEIKVFEIYEDIHSYFDAARHQYNANELLKLVEKHSGSQAIRAMGLFQVDLFIPILTYIFGQAIFNGNTGVVSTYRLRNEQYGLKEDNELLVERLRKVMIHELGHSFGLTHCLMPTCVMRSSTYVEDIDQKDKEFCQKCDDHLRSRKII